MDWFYKRKYKYYPYRIVKETTYCGKSLFSIEKHVSDWEGDLFWDSTNYRYTILEEAEAYTKTLHFEYYAEKIKTTKVIL